MKIRRHTYDGIPTLVICSTNVEDWNLIQMYLLIHLPFHYVVFNRFVFLFPSSNFFIQYSFNAGLTGTYELAVFLSQTFQEVEEVVFTKLT